MAKATIKTIAEEAGVSIATVSKALNDMPDVSKEVKEKIRDIAKRQGYHINMAAKQLAKGHSGLCGVVLLDIAEHNTAQAFAVLCDRLQRAGYTVHLGTTQGDKKAEAAILADLAAKGAELAIVQAATSDIRHIEQAAQGEMPVLYMGEAVNPRAKMAVGCDSYKGGMLAAQTLYEAGCKRVAVFTWGQAATGQHESVRGFQAFMQEQGLVARTYKHAAFLSEGAGQAMARQMLQEANAAHGAAMQGVFATHDLLAAGALCVFQKAGLRVPADIQMVGYGDYPFGQLGLLELTTIAQPYRELGLCVANMAADILGGKTEMVRKLTLEPVLVRRKTTKNKQIIK